MAEVPASIAADPVVNAERKVFTSLQAQFALMGRELTRCHRASDGRISFVVIYRGESRHFTVLHDVYAHLNALSDIAIEALQAVQRGELSR